MPRAIHCQAARQALALSAQWARAASRRPFGTARQAQESALKRQQSISASYYRGGTSRGIMMRREDLPSDQSQWDSIFLGCIGSPDPFGRQLDGMGGGISSLSKVCVVGPSSHPEADVDYTFVSLGVKNSQVDYSSNCGNMLAAVGPFAVDTGITPVEEGKGNGEEVTVRIYNTNTDKIIHSSFRVVDGEAAASGDFAIDGVSGTASPIRLDFIRPAGSRTGKLLPTGSANDTFEGITATCIDVGNPCVFVAAEELGVPYNLKPEQIDDHPTLKYTLESLRRRAAVRMGLAQSEDQVPGSVPKIAIVAPTGNRLGSDVRVRAMSVGQPHKAIPVTVALAVAAAAKLKGTSVFECVAKGAKVNSPLVIRHASGTIDVDGKFSKSRELEYATVLRTARRLMEGRIYWK
ncbi:hypothetical protein GQX73_g2125 [Xylaria multiplex]|uniref:PrpF protein n=1 Tax=Xylaria multiplex TaxID=323545 RepID=A0A7C8MYB9_9PEZI|nr:hypothetical protein GQX73_g2125 [Xylaria multiplex]